MTKKLHVLLLVLFASGGIAWVLFPNSGGEVRHLNEDRLSGETSVRAPVVPQPSAEPTDGPASPETVDAPEGEDSQTQSPEPPQFRSSAPFRVPDNEAAFMEGEENLSPPIPPKLERLEDLPPEEIDYLKRYNYPVYLELLARSGKTDEETEETQEQREERIVGNTLRILRDQDSSEKAEGESEEAGE